MVGFEAHLIGRQERKKIQSKASFYSKEAVFQWHFSRMCFWWPRQLSLTAVPPDTQTVSKDRPPTLPPVLPPLAVAVAPRCDSSRDEMPLAINLPPAATSGTVITFSLPACSSSPFSIKLADIYTPRRKKSKLSTWPSIQPPRSLESGVLLYAVP